MLWDSHMDPDEQACVSHAHAGEPSPTNWNTTLKTHGGLSVWAEDLLSEPLFFPWNMSARHRGFYSKTLSALLLSNPLPQSCSGKWCNGSKCVAHISLIIWPTFSQWLLFFCLHLRCTPCGCWARTSRLRSSWAWATTFARSSRWTTAASAPTSTSACRAKTAPTTGLRSSNTEVVVSPSSPSPFCFHIQSLRHLSDVTILIFI